MKAFQLIFMLFSMSGLAVPSVKATELPLKKAQELLLFRNSDIAIANSEFCKKSFEENEAKAVWYPSLDVVGNYNYLTEKNAIHFPEFPAGTPLSGLGGQTLQMGTNYKTEAGVDLSWPLTTAFVNMFNVRYRHLALTAKEAQNLGLKNQISFKLGALYLQWNMSFEQVTVYNTLVEQLLELLTQTENLKSGGLASPSRVLDVKARLAGARADLVSSQNQSDSLKLELLDLVQCQDSAFEPRGYSFAVDSASLAAVDTIKLNAIRPELLALDLSIEQLSVLQSIISGQKYPNLLAVAGFRYANPGLAMGSDKFMAYGQVGLQLKWNLFDGGKVSSQHRETDQQKEIAQKQRQQLVDTWNNAIKDAKLLVLRATRQADAAEASLAAADALVNDSKNNLAAGVATQADVLNALTGRARAALAVKQAAFMKNLAVLQLYFASGKELRF